MERFPAAVLFADISGFTPLAERLARRGPAGAEDLSDLLNAYFGQLTALIDAHAGEVVTFAGDGLLAAWPADDEDLAAMTWRAGRCALAVQAALHDYDVGDGLRLSLRIGVGAGEVMVLHIGGVGGRWELLLSGAPLIEASRAEERASRGEVVISADEPGRGRDGDGRGPGEGPDVAVEVGLVGVAAFRRDQGGAMPGGEAVGGVVEPDELGGALGGEAELGPEPGPQPLAAPADLIRQAVDAYPPPAGGHPVPGLGDLRIDRCAGSQPPAEHLHRDGEAFVPRSGGAQPPLGSARVPAPELLEGCHGTGEIGCCAEDRGRDVRRQPDLEAVDPAPATRPEIAGEEPDHDAAGLVPAIGVVDDALPLGQVDEEADGRVRDHGDVPQRAAAMAEPGHADPGQ